MPSCILNHASCILPSFLLTTYFYLLHYFYHRGVTSVVTGEGKYVTGAYC